MAVQPAPGWAFRAVSAVATGTTGLTITKPAGTVDDDILVMTIGHKGADWATVPAGWTLVARGLSGSTRGEMYWKRASGEGANYSVTDLATVAAGVISAYSGGLLVGNVVNASSVRENAAGATEGGDSITTTVEYALVLLAVIQGANNNLVGVGTRVTGGSDTIVGDPDLNRPPERADGGSSTASGIRVGFVDAIKTVTGATGAWGALHADVENVGLAAAFIPQPTVDTSGTRAYFTTTPPGVRITGPLAGRWDGTRDSARPWRLTARTYRLSRRKSGGGSVVAQTCYTNQQANFDLCLARFFFGPLAAQTIGGTVDLTWTIANFWSDVILGSVDSSVVRTKIHIYITKGQTAEVRHTLLRSYVEGADWPFLTAARTSFVAPVALTEGACEAGDGIMVEIGARVVSSPTPEPHYPPDEWTQLTITGFGTVNTSSAETHSGVPLQDASVGGYLDFSAVIEELDDDALEVLSPAPTNLTPADALEIPKLPYTEDGVDTTRAASHARGVWHKWTADEDRRVLATTYGSTHGARVQVFTGPDEDTLEELLYVAESSSVAMSPHRSLHALWFDAEAGETYWFRTRTQAIAGAQAASGGGLTRLGLYSRRAPRVDDIYVGASHVCALDACGNFVNMTSHLASYSPTAVAIDYTLRPLGPEPHEAERLLVGLHDGGSFVAIDLETLLVGEIDGDIDGYGTAGAKIAALLMDQAGRVLVGHFGDGYLHVAGPPPLPSYLNAPASDPAYSAVHRIPGDDYDGTVETFEPDVEVAAAHHLALDPEDDDVLHYTSGAWYRPASQVGGSTEELRAGEIRRYALTAGDQLDALATLPLDSSDPASGLRGLQVVPGGHGVLVANGRRVDWVNADGALVRSFYAPADDRPSFADVKLTHDGRYLWAWDDAEARLYQWELLTGGLTRRVETFLATGLGTQIALYQPDGIELCW